MTVAVHEWATELCEVGAGAYAFVQATGATCISNAGIVLTAEGPVLIDALFTPSMTAVLRGHAERVAGREPALIVNTHHHIDHTLGNSAFPRTPILASAAAREEMERIGFPYGAICQLVPHFAPEFDEGYPLRLPTVTFEETATLHLGDHTIELLHVGPAHTAGDVLVYLPEERLLYAGDVAFHYVTPLAFEGHVSNWLAVLDRIEGMAVDRVVPGHGPVGTKADLAEVHDYFTLLKTEARSAFDAGIPAWDAAREIYGRLGRFGGWGEAERVYPNVLRLFQEFRGEVDEPLDLAETWGGMARFQAEVLGGRHGGGP
jgi:cyclase